MRLDILLENQEDVENNVLIPFSYSPVEISKVDII